MSRDFPVNGLKELDAFLSALPANMQKGAYRAGLTAAAAVVRDEARMLASRSSGKMARAIKSGSPRQNQDGSFSITVRLDPKSPHAFIGVFQEYGVAPHLISAGDASVTTRSLNKRAKKSGVLKKMDNGLIRVGGYDYMNGPRGQRTSADTLKIRDAFIGGAVFHPGHAAHPFMRPALDIKADEAIKAFASKIRDYLEGKTGFAVPVDEAD
ncbi:HK97-gp10 family putative phage morphogenesis protein [Novosphingobium sp. KN65.2]|uniref:HK97-gp10 family putative phage morphogenesis protein n=1 Tax=Novosphingobium sp. KN65.2 TaxID=1478134 RepID=UPI0005DAEE44|nr:HK97-gp10 family putative phage morphogenesis protein [Novosphingobium sp. KN65.2]CDO34999.1 Phage protein, HK97, gp10 [Novosphingobium sp. KN65.2]